MAMEFLNYSHREPDWSIRAHVIMVLLPCVAIIYIGHMRQMVIMEVLRG